MEWLSYNSLSMEQLTSRSLTHGAAYLQVIGAWAAYLQTVQWHIKWLASSSSAHGTAELQLWLIECFISSSLASGAAYLQLTDTWSSVPPNSLTHGVTYLQITETYYQFTATWSSVPPTYSHMKRLTRTSNSFAHGAAYLQLTGTVHKYCEDAFLNLDVWSKGRIAPNSQHFCFPVEWTHI